MSNEKNDFSGPPNFSGAGGYVDADWEKEHSDIARCPDCFGPVLFRDWQDGTGKVIATHYRCVDCRLNWWADA